ncbi:MAG: M48 family metallopeptidase [Hyphomicrobiales bacterium]
MINLPSLLNLNKKPTSRAVTEIILDDEHGKITVLLSRNKRSKRMTLRQNLGGGNFKLTMPLRGTIAQARAFCQENLSWMQKHSNAMQDATQFKHGHSIPLRGKQIKLVFIDQLRGQIKRIDDELHVPGGADYAPRRLVNWLKAEAKKDILIGITKYQPLLEVKHSKLTIRDTKSRWGSCSSSKALSFSWRLVMAPEDVLDYVVAHELAHILEMNHSPKFWAHVTKVCPHMKSSQNWLKTNGGQLHQIRVK